MAGKAKPQRGDVVSVEPRFGDRVAIRLAGHSHTYVVKVAVSRGSEPKLAELAVIADDGHAVDYKAVRAIPVPRLAYAARQWTMATEAASRPFDVPDEIHETIGPRPDSRDARFVTDPDSKLTELPWRIEQAIMNGDPVRESIAHDLGVSTRTLDRMIAKAKALSLLDGIEIPRRPSPKQRDLLRARHLAEQWLDENGPHAEPPPGLLAELDRLRGQGTTKKQGRRSKR